jgi:L,D-transpeptidase YcbB
MFIRSKSARIKRLLWTLVVLGQSSVLIPAQAMQPIVSAVTSSPTALNLHFPQTVADLYQQNPDQLFWQDQAAIKAFEQQLAVLALSGVDLRYNQWLTSITQPDLSEKDRDWLLTDAFLGYLAFVSGVPSNGELWLYGKGSIPDSLPPSEIIQRWQSSLANQTTLGFVTSLQPQHPQYLLLEKALKPLLEQPDSGLKLADNMPTLRAGQNSDQMATLRGILINGKWLAAQPVESTIQVDNQFSVEMVAALKRFQQWQGLQPDGVIGPETRLWLNTTPQQRAAILALNMQRLRLLPDDTHNGIMVNIADYSLNYFVQGKQVLSSKVIVGRNDRRTPLMRSALNTVVINPPWNVPTNLVRQDIIPKVKQDPAYLQQHGYTLLSDWGANPVVINPYSIDWKTVNPKTFGYRVQQSAGPLSSLGRFKFNMPSSDAIYLHDTPNHKLFDRENRALSSGCVRVNKASELAQILLSNVGWDSNRLNQTVQLGTTRYVAIKQHIPVNLFYVTAFTDKTGQLIFRTDIYGYDQQAKRGLATINIAKNLL